MRYIRPAYTSARERRRDFWGGFAGNIALSLLLIAVTSLYRWSFPLQLPLQVLLMIVLAFTRRYIAFGALLSFASALMVVVIAAPVAFVACLVLSASPNAVAPVFLGGLLVVVIPAFFMLRAVDRRLRDQATPTPTSVDPPDRQV